MVRSGAFYEDTMEKKRAVLHEKDEARNQKTDEAKLTVRSNLEDLRKRVDEKEQTAHLNYI